MGWTETVKSGRTFPSFVTRRTHSLPAGFTLSELLVVIAVLGILAALLLPVLSSAKAKGDD